MPVRNPNRALNMTHRRPSVRLALLSVLILGLGAGCHTPLVRTEAGSYESEPVERVVGDRDGIVKQVLLYVPNRIVDAIDMVHFGVGLGLNLGPDIRITKWGQLALQAGVGFGVGYDDRSHNPAWASAAATAALGPWRTGAGGGSAPSVGDWEIAVGINALKFGVDLAEILDFVLGWFFIDILEDDYGYN